MKKMHIKGGRVKVLQVSGKTDQKFRNAASIITVLFTRDRKMKSLLRGPFNINISSMRCDANIKVEDLRGQQGWLVKIREDNSYSFPLESHVILTNSFVPHTIYFR